MGCKISPGVIINGREYTPPGRLWILAFAFRGCQWAIDEVEKDPSFRDKLIMDLYHEGFADGEGI